MIEKAQHSQWKKKQRQINENGAWNEITRLNYGKNMVDWIVCIWGVRMFMNVY